MAWLVKIDRRLVPDRISAAPFFSLNNKNNTHFTLHSLHSSSNEIDLSPIRRPHRIRSDRFGPNPNANQANDHQAHQANNI